jgi:hypothetical protein
VAAHTDDPRPALTPAVRCAALQATAPAGMPCFALELEWEAAQLDAARCEHAAGPSGGTRSSSGYEALPPATR